MGLGVGDLRPLRLRHGEPAAELDVAVARGAPALGARSAGRRSSKPPAAIDGDARDLRRAPRPQRPGHARPAPARRGATDRPPGSDRDGARPLRAARDRGRARALLGQAEVRRRPARPSEAARARAARRHARGRRRRSGASCSGSTSRAARRASSAPPDDPLQHMLIERAARCGMRVGDPLWVRLVDAAARARASVPTRPFEVGSRSPTRRPWNAGRWALRWDGESATARRRRCPAGARARRRRARRRVPRRHDARGARRAGRVRELAAARWRRPAARSGGNGAPDARRSSQRLSVGGTRPPLAPASVAGARGAAMPSTRIAFRPRPSFSRPSVDETSRPVRSRTRSSR